MSKDNLKRGLTEFNIFVNSLLSFLAAALILKLVIAFFRYKVILHFSGEVGQLNFEIVCTSPSFSAIWTYSAVYAIYGIGIFISLIIFVFAEVLFKITSRISGVSKLFFLWLSLLSLQHFLGFIFKGVILNQEFYYVLRWMHLPNFISYLVGFLSLILFILLVYLRFDRYLLIASSRYLIVDQFLKKRFAVINFFIVAIFGYLILFGINSFKVQIYEIIEFLVFLLALFISFFGAKKPKILTLKDETTSRINLFLIILVITLILAFILIKW